MIQGSDLILAWLHETFEIDAERGTLTWLRPPANHTRLRGRRAGSNRPGRGDKKYCYIKKDRHALKRGWLIFLWVHGRWPAPCLDHIDGNSTNDSIVNLREATITQNAWNHKGRKKKSRLPMGVRSLEGRFQARIVVNRKMLYLGMFASAAEASATYQQKRRELYGEFA